MDDISLIRLWAMRAAFVLLVCAILFFQLLPLETTPRRWAGPDLVMSFAFAWALRRPEYTPMLLVGLLLLVTDFLLGRPPGLHAALTLLAFENLRRRGAGLRDMPFTVEWLGVAAAMAAVTLGERLILLTLVAGVPALGLVMSQLVLTIVTYPLVVLVTRYLFGLRRIAIGEVNALGQRQS